MQPSSYEWPSSSAGLCFLLAASGCFAEGTTSASSAPPPIEVDAAFFVQQVRPLLSDKCFACHGPDDQTRFGGLRLDTEEGLLSVRSAGPMVVPGQPEASLLWKRISASDPSRMPPPPHTGLTKAQLETIEAWISAGAPYADHWAFLPVPHVEAPDEKDPASWARNGIDRFVARRLRERGLVPAPEAAAHVLRRRMYLDVTGLAPPRDGLETFDPDAATAALLASDAHAEHVARQWLDAARYADTHGFQLDPERVMWPWRDWVIDAFRKNQPYDEMLRDQIAGDLVPSGQPDQRLATGFSRNHPKTIEGGTLDDELRVTYVADRVDTLGTAVLGLTLNCARCHDHKYDPISHEEYYALFDCFNRLEEYAIGDAPTDRFGSPLRPDLDPVDVMIMREVPGVRMTYVLDRGQYDQPRAQVSCDVPRVLGALPEGAPRNRLGVAAWLTHPDHPLTARVAVNGIWQRYFGRGLVRTPEDFGSQGRQPTHPGLLDWLAMELVTSGWNLRHIEQLILRSATYRQAGRPPGLESETFYAGMPPKPLQAEEIRDQALSAAGLLDQTLGGPSVYPYQPDGLWLEANDRPNLSRPYPSSTLADVHRRSLYTFWKRTVPPPAMVAFDAPNREVSVVQRPNSITPLQALALLGDRQLVEAASALAVKMLEAEADGTDGYGEGYLRVLGRAPLDGERSLLEALRSRQRARFETDRGAAERLVSLGLASLEAPTSVVEWAAMTQVARAILSLDETLVRR